MSLVKARRRRRSFREFTKESSLKVLRVFLLLLLSSASRLLVCQSPQAVADDPIPTAELERRAMLGSIGQPEHETRVRQEDQQRQFSLLFNQLVEAVNNF